MEKQLIKYYNQLSEEAKTQLVVFAEFLVQRQDTIITKETPPEPLEIPRPAEETVVKAIKRLSKSYFMLDKNKMFHETSQYMTAHMMGGEEADAIIEQIEAMFKKYYEKFLEAYDK